MASAAWISSSAFSTAANRSVPDGPRSGRHLALISGSSHVESNPRTLIPVSVKSKYARPSKTMRKRDGSNLLAAVSTKA